MIQWRLVHANSRTKLFKTFNTIQFAINKGKVFGEIVGTFGTGKLEIIVIKNITNFVCVELVIILISINNQKCKAIHKQFLLILFREFVYHFQNKLGNRQQP